MRIIRRTDIITKTERKFIVRHGTYSQTFVCDQCGDAMMAVFLCGDFFDFSSRIIFRLIEAGGIHFLETETREIYICPASVRKALEITAS